MEENLQKTTGPELSLVNLEAPQGGRGNHVSVEEKLQSANAEIARLRTICFGDASIVDKKTFGISVSKGDSNAKIRFDTDKEAQVVSYLRDLVVTQGQRIDVEIWAVEMPLNSRHGDPKDRRQSRHKNVTEDDIGKINTALSRLTGKLDRPRIKIAYHE